MPKIRKNEPVYADVGHFVSAFSMIEALTHMLLRSITGMSDNIARIVFDGMRINDVDTRIRRLLPLSNFPTDIQGRIIRLLDQLREITKMRKALIHSVGFADDGKWHSTNRLTAREYAPFELTTFEPNAINSATLDLRAMEDEIQEIMQNSLAGFPVIDYQRYAWQYKPLSPKNPRPKRPHNQV
ncbi:MAG TPA: hypothetical protein VG537_11260 [Candidatus Kapabacteria bacterium]|jgi:hypothetical protein|nr:hypothetical protein [Candidatus Kapabacteria bacterium]